MNFNSTPGKAIEKRLVLSISRMTVHNGPGIRTTIMFKGCPLRCLWCSTPESQELEPEIAFYPNKCIKCDQCIPVCPLKAISVDNEIIKIDRSVCNNCGKCVQVCNAEALKLLGTPMSVQEIVDEVKKDIILYRRSNGGVTLSGGEPLLYPKFTRELLKAFKGEGINIGVDTCGYVPWAKLEPMLPFIDFFLWDIKHMDPQIHKKITGVSNRLILSNCRRVSERKIPLYIRVPFIPGYNNLEKNIRATCEFAKSLSSIVQVDLLPFHLLGKARYDSLDRDYPLIGTHLVSEDAMQQMKKLVESYGLKCTIGG
jgi:pyruvate formate lyase activating enzyme